MTTVTYTVPAIHCMHCVNTIKTELADLAGVQTVEADPTSKLVTITFSDPANTKTIENLLAEINFPVQKSKQHLPDLEVLCVNMGYPELVIGLSKECRARLLERTFV